MKQQMSIQQFIHKNSLSDTCVPDISMYWGFNDKKEEKSMLIWILLTVHKIKIAIDNIP